MTIRELLDEYNLADDDIRWSLCMRMAESFAVLLVDEGPEALAQRLWAGSIGDELYDMEERWMRDRGDRFSRTILDEGHLRDELSGMDLDRIKRRQS